MVGGSRHSCPVPPARPGKVPGAQGVPAPSPAGCHTDEVGHLVHVVGGQQHHFLLL